MPGSAAPGVVFNPEAGAQLSSGFQTLAELLGATLGPTQGRVLALGDGGAQLEWLGDGATVARRFLGLPERVADVGAMLLRNLVWRVHQRAGDGCATAAVLAHALLSESQRYLLAGADAALLRSGIAAATAAALEALHAQAQPVASERELLALARTAINEPRLSLLLAEVFDLLGADADVTIEDYVAPYLEREYHQGGRWQARLASSALVTSQVLQRAVLNETPVALFAGTLETVADVQPLLEALLRAGQSRLLLVAYQISGAALTTLVVNHQRQQLRVVAVELRQAGQRRADDLADLAALTGARLLSAELGQSPRQLGLADLGHAQRVEISGESLLVVGPFGQPGRTSEIAALRARHAHLPAEQDDERAALRTRIARLVGTTATLKLGATTKLERALLRQHAEQGLRVLRGALGSGAVPGGGLAYLQCIPTVRQLELPGDQAYGAAIVARALAAPFERIVANAGRRSPAVVLAEMQRRGAGYGYDAARDTIIDLRAAGLLDSAEVLATALRAAASGASTALTTSAVVLKRSPRVSLEP